MKYVHTVCGGKVRVQPGPGQVRILIRTGKGQLSTVHDGMAYSAGLGG
jgi:hypothetical protein